MPALKSSRQISTLRGSKWDGERCAGIRTGARGGWGGVPLVLLLGDGRGNIVRLVVELRVREVEVVVVERVLRLSRACCANERASK